jgi:hypothetical protein
MATNRIDILDPALLRPGRIDRKIEFPNPDEGSRADILRIHSRKMNLVRGIDLKKVADRMTGASGAELKARRRAGTLAVPAACMGRAHSWFSVFKVLHSGPAWRSSPTSLAGDVGSQVWWSQGCLPGSWTKLLARVFTDAGYKPHAQPGAQHCWSRLGCLGVTCNGGAQACCTEAGMFALRERRVHVTQARPEPAHRERVRASVRANLSDGERMCCAECNFVLFFLGCQPHLCEAQALDS